MLELYNYFIPGVPSNSKRHQIGEKDLLQITYISNDNAGSAHVGMVGGQQSLRLSPDFWYKAVFMHELGHTLGLFDEVTRPDRDNYVEIFWENIQPEAISAFQKIRRNATNLLGQPYDYDSIMAYDEVAFSKDPSQLYTIRAKNGYRMKAAGEKEQISKGDVQKIQELYRCKVTKNTAGDNF
nr:PREDICTED: astacin-like metalloprotease toxin 2 [Bemisia tabaci]